MSQTILVTGASGPLGRGVINHLLDANNVSPTRIIATTRKPEKLAELSARGVVVRRADFNDAGTLDAAFAGADRVLIISTDELDLVGGKRLKQQEAAVAAAKKAGASHLAYTSMVKPEPGSPMVFANDHYGTEQALKATGLSYTIFRNNSYDENLLMSLPTILKMGSWYTAAAEGRVAYAARDDMAAAIAGRLAAAANESTTFTLTGPKAYSYAEVAALVTKVTGRPIALVPVSDEALAAGMKANGMPEDIVRLVVSVDVNVRAGNLEVVNDSIEKLSRRKPLALDRFLERNKAALM